MRQLLSFVALLLTFLPWSLHAGTPQKLKMYSADKKKYELVKVVDHQGVTLSENCQKKGKMDCAAWKAVQNKVALEETAGVGVIGNPAARYCLSQKSLNRILIDQQGKEYDFCVFPDGSAVDAWSLFNKHFEGKN